MKQTIQQINILNDYIVPQKVVEKISDRDLIAKRKELKAIINEANEILDKAIDPELFKRADKCEVWNEKKGKMERKYGVDSDTVIIVERPNFNFVPLSFAKKKNAIKIVPDSDVLKPMWQEGVQIPGVKLTEYVTVK